MCARCSLHSVRAGPRFPAMVVAAFSRARFVPALPVPPTRMRATRNVPDTPIECLRCQLHRAATLSMPSYPCAVMRSFCSAIQLMWAAVICLSGRIAPTRAAPSIVLVLPDGAAQSKRSRHSACSGLRAPAKGRVVPASLSPCFRRLPQAIQIVRPFLHHFTALRQIFRKVVGGAHSIAFAMGKLTFYPIAIVALLVQEG